MKTVYLSLGSNLGDRAGHLAEALRRLGEAGVRVLRRSAVYETEPRDVLAQPWFLNLVAEAETALFPRQLLARVLKIEREMGRRRMVDNDKGPRVIDIDILLYGAVRMETESLTIPHPRMSERRFVLEPLAELAPGLRHPVSGKSMAELLDGVNDQVCRHWQRGALI